jgi:hypothetical protein
METEPVPRARILSHLKPRVLADTLGLPLDSTILKPRVNLGFRD